MKRKKRKRAHGTIELDGHTLISVEVPVEVSDPGDPCSHVQVGCSFRKSENYNSVSVNVNVEVPTRIGEEQKGADYAAELCSKFIDELRAPALDSLKAL